MGSAGPNLPQPPSGCRKGCRGPAPGPPPLPGRAGCLGENNGGVSDGNGVPEVDGASGWRENGRDDGRRSGSLRSRSPRCRRGGQRWWSRSRSRSRTRSRSRSRSRSPDQRLREVVLKLEGVLLSVLQRQIGLERQFHEYVGLRSRPLRPLGPTGWVAPRVRPLGQVEGPAWRQTGPPPGVRLPGQEARQLSRQTI